MAEIGHAYIEDTTEDSHTGDLLWVETLTMASANFTVGNKYLIVATCRFRGSSISGTFGVRLKHGTVAFPGSDKAISTNTALSWHTYTWFTVWTAISGEDVLLEQKTFGSARTVRSDAMTIFIMDLNDLVENTDWHYNENSTATTLPNGWTSSNNAAVTFTPPASTDWIVFARSRMNVIDKTLQYQTRINRSGAASSTEPQISQEGAGGDQDDTLVFSNARVFIGLTAASHTFTEESGLNGAGSTEDRTHSAVFALNLNKFDVRAVAHTEAEIDLSATDFATEVQTVSITPNAVGDVWTFGAWIYDAVAAGIYCKARMQVDNADQPPAETTDADQREDSFDALDELPISYQTLENLSAAAHNIDMDGSCETAATGRSAEDRTLFAITMELAAATSIIPEIMHHRKQQGMS